MMRKIGLREVIEIAKEYGLRPCRVKGTKVVQIRKSVSDRLEDIEWDEFGDFLASRGLAVYRAENSDYLKIMKDD